MSMTNEPTHWESRYRRGEAIARYPFDVVVSFFLSRWPAARRADVRVLDYGSGGGNHARFLAAEGFDAYAVDSAPMAVDMTRQALAGIGIDDGEDRVALADFTTLPYADGFFHALLDRQALCQNRADALPDMVGEISRVLAPGGIYFGVNFSDRHPDLRYAQSLGGGDYGHFTAGPMKDQGAKHFFGRTEIENYFHCFDIEDIRVLRTDSLMGKAHGSEELIVIAAKRDGA